MSDWFQENGLEPLAVFVGFSLMILGAIKFVEIANWLIHHVRIN